MEKLLALLNKLSKTLQAKGNHVEDGSNPAEPENTAEIVDKPQKKLSKKKLGVIGAAVAIVAIVIVILLIPSKFDRVENECVHIAGSVASGNNYFTLETIPDTWDNMDPTVRALMLPSHQEGVLEAVKYANKELGFPSSVYSDMMNTSALMGRQVEENNKYKVSWTYHPDDGLTVTYTKK